MNVKPPLDYRAIDVDNHYYEPIDSCTRHLPKEFKRRGVQMLTEGKRTFAVMGGCGQPFHPEPDVRSDHRARVSGPAVPRRDPPRAWIRRR